MPRGMDIGAAIGRAVSGVGDLYQRNKAQQKQDEQLAAREKFDRLRMELEDMYRQAGLIREDRRDQREEERYQQGRKDQTAAVTASTLRPGDELDPWTVSQIEGTPQEPRLGQRRTLPSRPAIEGYGTADPGGDPYGDRNIWQPTAAEQRGLKQDQERDTFINGLPKRAASAAKARTYGIPLDPDDLKTPEDVRAEQEAEDLHHLGILDRELSVRDRHERPPAASADEQRLPRELEQHLNTRRTRGESRDVVERDLGEQWSELLATYPKLSPVALQSALDRLWPTDPRTGEPRAFGRGEAKEREEMPAADEADARSSFQRDIGLSFPDRRTQDIELPSGQGLRDVGIDDGTRIATSADVAEVAKSHRISNAEARKRLRALGVILQD